MAAQGVNSFKSVEDEMSMIEEQTRTAGTTPRWQHRRWTWLRCALVAASFIAAPLILVGAFKTLVWYVDDERVSVYDRYLDRDTIASFVASLSVTVAALAIYGPLQASVPNSVAFDWFVKALALLCDSVLVLLACEPQQGAKDVFSRVCFLIAFFAQLVVVVGTVAVAIFRPAAAQPPSPSPASSSSPPLLPA